MMRWAWVLVTAGLAVAPAQGQLTLTSVPAAIGPLEVNAPGAWLNVTAQLSCQAVLSDGGVANPQRSLTFDPPSATVGLVVRGSLSAVMDTSACSTDPTGFASLAVPFEVLASEAAPGVEPLQLRWDAAVQPFVPGPAWEAGAAANATVAYHGKLAANAPTTIFQLAPGSARGVDLDLRALTNSPARVSFAAEWQEDGPGRLVVPDPMVLQPGATIPVDGLRFEASDRTGFDNREGMVRLTLTHMSLADPDQQGDPVQVTMLLRVHSSPVALAGTLLVAAMLLAGAGWAAWKWRAKGRSGSARAASRPQ